MKGMVQLAEILFLATGFRLEVALSVTTPSALWTVVAKRPYTFEWESPAVELRGNNQRVDVDLYSCGDHCSEDECGTWVANLCSHKDAKCTPVDGTLEVVMPEPVHGISWGYKVRVTNPSLSSTTLCSDEFRIVASDEALALGKVDRLFLEVVSPQTGDLAIVGEEYTVQFIFAHGIRSPGDRFTIDLYMFGGGSGDCGVWVGSLCDEPDIGCKASGDGIYDVTIPLHAQPGYYSIRVGRAGYDSQYDCSGAFELISDISAISR